MEINLRIHVVVVACVAASCFGQHCRLPGMKEKVPQICETIDLGAEEYSIEAGVLRWIVWSGSTGEGIFSCNDLEDSNKSSYENECEASHCL